MPVKKALSQTHKVIISVVVILLVAVGLIFFWFSADEKPTPPAPPTPPATKATQTPQAEKPAAVKGTIKPQRVLDYDNLGKDTPTGKLVKERKSRYGVDKSIDIIAKPEESVIIRGTKIPMQDIADEIRLKEGLIIEKSIDTPFNIKDLAKHEFGIHVVKPGDSIWTLHFDFLKDYFNKREIALSPMADEPKRGGLSSGIGKLLKFSENKVYVYNIHKKRLETDLNLIQPKEKIIVYNMSRVFALLDQIDYSNVNRIHFDGDTLWIPAKD